ncbi:hypothetical protein AQUCO_03000133v1 [Aquilegia coerulea]|uniref:Uncharacterized protein n=1 Tax=Aquilegia coerulea TaxID=218851 RepID=A0A2G5D1D7_AQUCA|nr:hypothetical protein AQUCO_03000133v1 [Aquilegia coerulea]
MGYVVVISLPMILLILILSISCYLCGRARGRTQASTATQMYGPPPVTPVHVQDSHQVKPSNV